MTRRGGSPRNPSRGVFMLEPQLPVRHEWLVRERDHAKLALEPFEPGFALAAGNAYRRVLLSSIHGSAPTWVKIENVLHEFSYLQGVTEDTLDIMLNLRKVVFSLHLNRPKILRLKAQGVGAVRACDFEPDADVEILTPDQPLATLDKDGTFEMEVCVERGRGYVPAEKREPEALPINALLLDANFSPIKRVNFTVETLPGKDKEERLLLEVWTNGSVSPELAVAEASRILEDHFNLLVSAPAAQPTEEGEAEPCELLPRAEINETLFRNVDELELSVRASNCLKTDEHPGDRRSRAEDRGGAPEDQELRQEIAERDRRSWARWGCPSACAWTRRSSSTSEPSWGAPSTASAGPTQQS